MPATAKKKQLPNLGGNGPRVVPADGVVGYIKEVELARRLGTNRQWVRKFRNEKLTESTDWYHEGRGRLTRVWWTESGVRKVEAVLGIKGLTVEKAHAEELQVVRSGFRNSRVIECQRATGERVIVRVKDNSNYTPMLNTGKPMIVLATKDQDGPCYHVVGRAPRYRGRW